MEIIYGPHDKEAKRTDNPEKGGRIVQSLSRPVLCGNLFRRISWLNYDVSVASAER